MKKTWQTLNNILVLGRNNLIRPPSNFVDETGHEMTDNATIATKFNDFFTNIGPSLANKIADPDPSVLNHNSPLSSMYLSPCTMYYRRYFCYYKFS